MSLLFSAISSNGARTGSPEDMHTCTHHPATVSEVHSICVQAVLCSVFSRSHRRHTVVPAGNVRKAGQRPPPRSLQHVTLYVRLRRPGLCRICSLVSNPDSLLALTAAPLAAQAFTVETPVNWLSNTTVTVNWTSVTTDPEFFTIEVCPEAPTLRQKPLTTHPFYLFHSYSTQ